MQADLKNIMTLAFLVQIGIFELMLFIGKEKTDRFKITFGGLIFLILAAAYYYLTVSLSYKPILAVLTVSVTVGIPVFIHTAISGFVFNELSNMYKRILAYVFAFGLVAILPMYLLLIVCLTGYDCV